MKKHLKSGLIFVGVFLILYFIFYFVQPILAILLNYIGFLSVMIFLPAKYCNIDIMVCRAPTGILFSLFVSAILYFLVGVLISILFRRKK